ncbi:MAG: hypothetical protein AAF362_15535 [Pseudomonadota bacterium]
MSDMDDTDATWRALVVVAVTLAYPLAQTGFELGAYGELLFDNKLVAWTAVTATMLAFAVMPKRLLPMPRWHIWIFSIPSVWLLGRFLLGVSNPGAQIHPLLFAAGIASFVICFPYAIYLIVRMANPDLADIRGVRSWSIVMSIAGIIFVIGFLTGSWNQYFIACQDARVNGTELPLHCIENPGDRTSQTDR